MTNNRYVQYAKLMRFDKPIGTFLILWPILWALSITGAGHPPLGLVGVFIIGLVVMRAAGCVINHIWDREYDKHVARTQDRPLAAGKVSVFEAVILVGILLTIAAILVLTLNLYTLCLAFAGVLGTLIYPLMKRITYYPQVILGIVFNWGILMVFSAMQNNVPALAWLLLATALLWTLAYDTLYAMADREDDLKIGVKSTAILLGEMDRPAIAIFQILFLLGLVLIGKQLQLSAFFYWGLVAVLGLFAYEWWLIRNREPQACFCCFSA